MSLCCSTLLSFGTFQRIKLLFNHISNINHNDIFYFTNTFRLWVLTILWAPLGQGRATLPWAPSSELVVCLHKPDFTLLYCWGDCKLEQPPWTTGWRFLKKLKIEIPHNPAIPLLGIYPEKNMIQKDTSPNVHCRSVDNSQDVETM